MSDKEVKERIETEAEVIASYYRDKLEKSIARSCYTAGATTERPKAWNDAIDEIILEVVKHHVYGETTNLIKRDEVIKTIEKLKHKQP
jgi:hypothetical protein